MYSGKGRGIHSGKEITDDVMNDLFMETAKKIDEDKYNLLLKDEFVKVQVKAFE